MKSMLVILGIVIPFSIWFSQLSIYYFIIYFVIHWALGEIFVLKNKGYSFSPVVNILKFIMLISYFVISVVHGKVVLAKNIDLFLAYTFFQLLIIFLQFRERKNNPTIIKVVFFELTMIPVFFVSFYYLELPSMVIILQHTIFFFLASLTRIERKNIPIYLAQNIAFTIIFFAVGMKSSPLYIEVFDLIKYYLLLSYLHITNSFFFSPYTPAFLFKKISGINRKTMTLKLSSNY